MTVGVVCCDAQVKAGSKAESLGVRPGDIVHSINGQSTNQLTLSDALSLIYGDNKQLSLQLSTYVGRPFVTLGCRIAAVTNTSSLSSQLIININRLSVIFVSKLFNCGCVKRLVFQSLFEGCRN